jgi:hypothetical protein
MRVGRGAHVIEVIIVISWNDSLAKGKPGGSE